MKKWCCRVDESLDFTMIRNHEMLNQVQHNNGGEFNVTLNLVQGLMNIDPSVFDYGLQTLIERRISFCFVSYHNRFFHSIKGCSHWRDGHSGVIRVDPNFQIKMSQPEETEEGHLRFAVCQY